MNLIVGQPWHYSDDVSIQEVVRLKKIEFTDFRNITKGSVEFPNAELNNIREKSPSILGIYGQNGSGKTSVLMALSILKRAFTDQVVAHKDDSYIREGCDRCTLSYTFGLYTIGRNAEGEVVENVTNQKELFYRLDLTNEPDEYFLEKMEVNSYDIPEDILFVENEVLQMREYRADGTIARSKQTLMDTSFANSDKKGIPFGNRTKFKEYAVGSDWGDFESAADELTYGKLNFYIDGKSFLFWAAGTFCLDISEDDDKKIDFIHGTIGIISTIIKDPDYDPPRDWFSAHCTKELAEEWLEFVDKIVKRHVEMEEIYDQVLLIIRDIDDVLCHLNPKHERYTPPAERTNRKKSDSTDFQKIGREMLFEMYSREKKLRMLDYKECAALASSLKEYGTFCLHIIDTSITGQTNLNTMLPLLLWGYREDGNCQTVYSESVNLNMDQETDIDERDFPIVEQSIASINTVLAELIPGLQLDIDDLGTYTDEEDTEKHSFEIQSVRGDVSIPLRYESDGVRRIVSLASLFIAVYNEPSFTLAVDEIDAGIFEYLLGELFQVLSESAQGQFIFTSHNLRPLEVLPAKNLCFTSVNPENRFVKLRDRGNCNLRDTYFRMIILGSGEDAVYQATDRYKLQRAFLKAGRERAEKE